MLLFRQFLGLPIVSSFRKVASSVLVASPNLEAKAFLRPLEVEVLFGGVFTNTQGGGRRMRDIREKVSIIRGVIDHVNRHDNQLYLLLTEISKAFDSVPHNAIRAYEFFGFPQGVVEPVSNMVTDNQARVLTTTLSRRFPMGKGTRQGDSLSPTTYGLVHQLVLLYVRHRMKGYSTVMRKLWNAAHADDCNLFSDRKEDIERGANAMFAVLSHLKMAMHPDKLSR